MSKLFCIVGETASGKDSIVNGLNLDNIKDTNNNLHKVVSYTTRKKRDNETEGVEHYFVSDKEYDLIHQSSKIIAETKIGDYRYMATEKECQVSDIYIIDPNGIKNLKERLDKNLIDLVIIYIRVPFEERMKRASIRSDFNEEFIKRVTAENDQFEDFYIHKDFDYVIFNTCSLESSINQLEHIMNYELSERIKRYE